MTAFLLLVCRVATLKGQEIESSIQHVQKCFDRTAAYYMFMCAGCVQTQGLYIRRHKCEGPLIEDVKGGCPRSN